MKNRAKIPTTLTQNINFTSFFTYKAIFNMSNY